MLLQTNSYLVPHDKLAEHARLMRRFRQTMSRLGCEEFDVYEESGPNWGSRGPGRFVQIMRFRDRKHFQTVQAAERADATAQELIQEFCDLVDLGAQQERGEYAVKYYSGTMPETLTVGMPYEVEPAAEEIAGASAQEAAAEPPRGTVHHVSEADARPATEVAPPPATQAEPHPIVRATEDPLASRQNPDQPHDSGGNNKPA